MVDLEQGTIVNDFPKPFQSLQNNILNDRQTSSNPHLPTIFRAPPLMRAVDATIYEPRIISFGPHHYGKPHLAVTQSLKELYVKNLLKRNLSISHQELLQNIWREVANLAQRAKAAYSEKPQMSDDEFIHLMLLDSCFMVELLLNMWPPEENTTLRDDPIIGVYWRREQVTIDVLMLENQLPYFLLKTLFNLIYPTAKFLPLAVLAIHYFGVHLLFRSEEMIQSGYFNTLLEPDFHWNSDGEPHHLLHIFHTLLLRLKELNERPTERGPSPVHAITIRVRCEMEFRIGQFMLLLKKVSSVKNVAKVSSIAKEIENRLLDESSFPNETAIAIKRFMERTLTRIFIRKSFVMTDNVIPRAKVLTDAGVKFKANKNSMSFLNVSFKAGTLEMSQLPFWHKTNYLLRNLIAFEQCCPIVGTNLSTYAVFMGCLVFQPEDVAILRKEDIILKLGCRNERAAEMVNKLCDGVWVHPTSRNYLSDVCKDINRYSDTTFHNHRAKLYDKFLNPFKTITIAAASILLAFAIVQGVITILSYAKHFR